MLYSCAYLDVVLSYEVRLPFLQDLEEDFHKMVQKCWVLWRLYYYLQMGINKMQCDMKWSVTIIQKQGTYIPNVSSNSLIVTYNSLKECDATHFERYEQTLWRNQPSPDSSQI
jgi:hypothetical protein